MKIDISSLRGTDSYRKMSSALGVSENTIGNIERKGVCTLPILLRICQYYHVSAVLGEDGVITFHKTKEQRVIEL